MSCRGGQSTPGLGVTHVPPVCHSNRSWSGYWEGAAPSILNPGSFLILTFVVRAERVKELTVIYFK